MDKELLYRFFEGKTSFEEEKEIRIWMEASLENQMFFFQERKLFDAMILLPEKENSKRNDRSIHRFIWPNMFRAAGIIILVLLGNYIYQNLVNHDLGMQTIYVPVGQRANILLPDGTDVWLNAGTTLSYPVTFNKKQRTVTLDGEAYFDVTFNNKAPFLVKTSKCNIEVLGTKFNVEAYSKEEVFETTLMKGKVKVTSVDDPEKTLMMYPDQKLIMSNGNFVVSCVNDYNPYRWKEGLICFKNELFLNVMDEFEKYYGFKIIVNNKDVLKYSYTGKFRQEDGVDYALSILKKSISFNFKKDDINHVIYIY